MAGLRPPFGHIYYQIPISYGWRAPYVKNESPATSRNKCFCRSGKNVFDFSYCIPGYCIASEIPQMKYTWMIAAPYAGTYAIVSFHTIL